ncbi:hypothetical protein NDU88_004559 [Pleurodeles waltl]|uniref:Uncharacterized protein n=1 Tax=Pleurodeles waltl TaxID=8319 RepID=A0AAV7QI82_PLEWA|nr:hypothetical protein NDU88_004559 [Pleurodeles waltl]
MPCSRPRSRSVSSIYRGGDGEAPRVSPDETEGGSAALGDATVHLCLLLWTPWLLQDEEEKGRAQWGAGDISMTGRGR